MKTSFTIKLPEIKERKRFAPASKIIPPKKGGKYNRKASNKEEN